MVIPSWIFFLVAAWVILFGVFRLSIAIRKLRASPEGEGNEDRPSFQKRGLYALSPKRHVIFGVLYLLLGACLVAMGLGWQPPLK